MLASTDFRLMSLAGRGLLYTVRLECWVNGSVPASPAKLARLLCVEPEEAEAALAEIRPFTICDGDRLRCPELDAYRRHLDERRQRLSDGGKAGAAVTNGRRTAKPAGRPRAGRSPLVQNSPIQKSPIPAVQSGAESADPWLSDYERESRGH